MTTDMRLDQHGEGYWTVNWNCTHDFWGQLLGSLHNCRSCPSSKERNLFLHIVLQLLSIEDIKICAHVVVSEQKTSITTTYLSFFGYLAEG